jgi:MFS family permease
LLTTFVAGVLCGPLVTFSPVLILNVFHGTASQFSVAVAAFGIGGVAGAIALLGVDPSRDRRGLSIGFGAAYGAMLIAAALTPAFAWLPPVLALAGIAMSVTNTSTNTLLQTAAPGHLRGRTVSVYMLAMRGGLAIGSLLSGLLVARLGIRETLIANGAVAIVLQLAIGAAWLRAPAPAVPARAHDPA